RPVSRSKPWIPGPPAAPTTCCWPRGAPWGRRCWRSIEPRCGSGHGKIAILIRIGGDMQSIIDNPRAALGAGLAITAVLLIGWLIVAGADGLGLLSFLVRLVHVLA